MQESESEEEVEAEVETPGKEGGRVKVEMGAGDTSDVEEVAPPPPPPRTALAARDGEQEVQATASTGGLLNLPHARALCPSAPFRAPQGAFAKRPLHGNAEACPRCYCYICDAPAGECTQWQSDYRKAPSHCNAHDIGSRNGGSCGMARKGSGSARWRYETLATERERDLLAALVKRVDDQLPTATTPRTRRPPRTPRPPPRPPRRRRSARA